MMQSPTIPGLMSHMLLFNVCREGWARFPVLLSTESTWPLKATVVPGCGQRRLVGGWDAKAKDGCHVAISWAVINVKAIRRRCLPPGQHSRLPLYRKDEDVAVMTNEIDVPKGGGSCGACVAMSLVSWMLRLPLREDVVSITGDLDLRGRLHPVLGLVEKAKWAMEEGVELIIAPKVNVEACEKDQFANFSSVPGLQEYARNTFCGAATMAEVMGLAVEGE